MFREPNLRPLFRSLTSDFSNRFLELPAIFQASQPPSRHYKKEVKRFYKRVSLTQHDGHWEVNLDRRKLKTPLGNLFRVPTEPLALGVAAEWDAQKELIKQHNMYLTNLCNTGIDNPLKRTTEQVAEDVLRYLDTDTVCYRVEGPPELVQLQRKAWDPVVQWVEERHGLTIGSSETIQGPVIPKETKEKLGRLLRSYSLWSLIGLEHVVQALKSVVLALALVDRNISVDTAVALSRLEEEYQIGQWGKVEWAHDVELMHLQASIAASVLFIYFTTEVESISRSLKPEPPNS